MLLRDMMRIHCFSTYLCLERYATYYVEISHPDGGSSNAIILLRYSLTVSSLIMINAVCNCIELVSFLEPDLNLRGPGPS